MAANTNEYYSKLPEEDRKSYDKKLTLKSGEKLPDPYQIESKQWIDAYDSIPDISSRDVSEYLLDTPSEFTKESIKAYKSLEAYDYFVHGHVQDCYYTNIDEGSKFCFVKSEVRSIENI